MNAYELTLLANSGDNFLRVLSAFHPQTMVSVPLTKAAYDMPLADTEAGETVTNVLAHAGIKSVGQAAELMAKLGAGALAYVFGQASAKNFQHTVLKNLYAVLPLEGKIAFWSGILNQYTDQRAA